MYRICDLVERLQSCTDHNQIKSVIKDICDQLGFERFAALKAVVTPTFKATGDIATNYPAEWQQRYFEQNYYKIDPIFRHCFNSALPIDWSRADTVHDNIYPWRLRFRC